MKRSALSFIICGMLATTCAHAEGLTGIDISLASEHSVPRSSGQWCQTNPGLALESGRWLAGVYHSSLCTPVWIAGYGLPLGSLGPVQFGALVAVDKGYASPLIGSLSAGYKMLRAYVAPEVVGGKVVGAEIGFALHFNVGR